MMGRISSSKNAQGVANDIKKVPRVSSYECLKFNWNFNSIILEYWSDRVLGKNSTLLLLIAFLLSFNILFSLDPSTPQPLVSVNHRLFCKTTIVSSFCMLTLLNFMSANNLQPIC